MILTFLLIATAQSQPAVDSFNQFMKNAKSLSVEVEVRRTGLEGTGNALLVLARPNQLSYRIKWNPYDYKFVMNRDRVLEVERHINRYDEYEGTGQYALPRNTVSALGDATLPLAIVAGDLRALANSNSEYKPIGPATMSGLSGERFQTSYQDQEGATITVEVILAPDGRLLYDSVSQEGFKQERQYRNYRVNQPLPKQVFSLDPPVGTLAFGVPESAPPIEPGNKAKLGRWTNSRTGKQVDLLQSLGGKLTLVALLAPSCESSQQSLATLKELKEVPVVIATGSKASEAFRSSGFPTYLDFKGDSMRALHAPGTPMFYLIDPSGTVRGAWFGFTQTDSEMFLKDMRRAISAASKPAK